MWWRFRDCCTLQKEDIFPLWTYFRTTVCSSGDSGCFPWQLPTLIWQLCKLDLVRDALTNFYCNRFSPFSVWNRARCVSTLLLSPRRIDLNIDDIDPSIVLVLDQCKWNCPHFINEQLHTGEQCSIHILHYTLCPLPSLALTFCRIASIQVVCPTVQGREKKKKEKPNLKLLLKNNKILVLLDIKPLL